MSKEIEVKVKIKVSDCGNFCAVCKWYGRGQSKYYCNLFGQYLNVREITKHNHYVERCDICVKSSV